MIESPWSPSRSVAARGHVMTPALLLVLLFTITGIPPTEEQALRSRGEDYRRYQQETSIFVPWSPNRR